MRIDYEKKGQFSQKVFFPLMVKPAEKSFCTIRRPCIPHKQWFDIIQELMIPYCTKVESSLLQIDPALCWNFSQTILNFFFWHPLFWLVLFHVVCHCLLFCFENVWEKFHLWAGSIWSKPDSTLVCLTCMIFYIYFFIYKLLINCIFIQTKERKNLFPWEIS